MAGWNSDFRLVTAQDLEADYKSYENGKGDGERTLSAKKLADDLAMLRNNGDYEGEMQKLKAIDPQAEKALRNATVEVGAYIVFH